MRVCRASTGGRSGGQGPTRASMFFVGSPSTCPITWFMRRGTWLPFRDIVASVLVTNRKRAGINLDAHQLRAQLRVSTSRRRHGSSKKPRLEGLGLVTEAQD
jgi:hypothetical protein